MGDARSDGGLPGKIRQEIRDGGSISFARFQELCLFDPDGGYYTRGASIGRAGADFWTAPEMSPTFGHLIATQIAEMADHLGAPSTFRVVEVGAGNGSLAHAILDECRRARPDLYRPGSFGIVETSPVLRDIQRQRLHDHADMVTWLTADAAVPRPGVVMMNEVVDALPVHRVFQADGGLQEIRVGLHGEELIDVQVPASTELSCALAEALPAGQKELPLGQEAEVRLSYGPFLEQVTRFLDSGYLLNVDYGMSADELYAPTRTRGTTLAYHRHQAHDDLLARPGEQDLTAHVDLDLLAGHCRRLGFEVLGTTSQMRFLIALGLEERMLALENSSLDNKAKTEQRLAMASLVRPGGMGEMFKVTIAGRGVMGGLRGLNDPFLEARPASKFSG